jgi:protein-disulfide isomerase
MRLVLAFLLPFLVAAAPPPARTARDWSAVAAKLPSGSFLIGNPAARVKLVEYASYTCPHCAAFSAESEPVLRPLVRSGRVSWEIRHMVRDSTDLAAAIVARCAGPRGFARTTRRLFAEQQTWLARAMDWGEANGARIATYPVMARLRAQADGAGLSAIGQAEGLSPARLNACFADEGEANRLAAMNAAIPPSVNGTPSFFINGRQVPGASWAALQPALAAAGAK